MTTYADTAKLSLGTRSQHFWLDVFCSWRDMSPYGDIDEERIRNSYCSSTFPLFGEVTCSMLRECRPSLGSGVALRFEHGKLVDPFPAQGHQLRGKLVFPPFLALTRRPTSDWRATSTRSNARPTPSSSRRFPRGSSPSPGSCCISAGKPAVCSRSASENRGSTTDSS